MSRAEDTDALSRRLRAAGFDLPDTHNVNTPAPLLRMERRETMPKMPDMPPMGDGGDMEDDM